MSLSGKKGIKILSFFIALSMAFSCFFILPICSRAESELTPETTPVSNQTYTIATAEQLLRLSEFSQANTCSNMTFRLIADIDLNPGCIFRSDGSYDGTPTTFKPIGKNGCPFKGSFDGGVYTIRGLYINDSSESRVGLFGYTSGADISNVTLQNSYVSGNGTVGGICGEANNTTITNCSNAAYVSGSGAFIGGICGLLSGNNSVISSCANSVAVSSSYNGSDQPSAQGVGGICGAASSENAEDPQIISSYNIAAISGSAACTGGIVGYTTVPIAQCYNTGNITGVDYVGGIVGCADAGSIQNTYNLADISGNDYVGGLVGCSYATIYAAYSVGDITCLGENKGPAYGSSGNTAEAIYVLSGESKSPLSSFAGKTLPAGFESSVWELQNTQSTYCYPALKNIPNPDLSCDEDGVLLNQITVDLPAAPTGGQDKTHTVTATYQTAAASSTVYSFDIEWGDMDFTYTAPSAGTWNPSTHTYEGATSGSWSCEPGENVIRITNHSNTAVLASFSYTPSQAYSTISGTFSAPSIALETAVGTTPNQAPSNTTSLTLGGNLTDTEANNTTIGQISIQITAN